MTKREKEILFDAEKGIFELRETIKGRGRNLTKGEFAALASGYLNGLGFASIAFDIKMSEDFEEEILALLDRIID